MRWNILFPAWGVAQSLTDANSRKFELPKPVYSWQARWRYFTHNELQMIRYGLAQVYGDPDITKLLKQLNSILSPELIKEIDSKGQDWQIK